MLTTSLIEDILAKLPRVRIGLVGDLFLDRYLDIDPALTEPSIETGLDAYQVVAVRSYPGALGTIINNLAALGVGKILPVTLIGEDGEGHDLQQALSDLSGYVSYATFQAAYGWRTPTYTKPMLGSRELNRIDIKNRSRMLIEHEEGGVLRAIQHSWHDVDAWIVLDQVSEENCGVITDRVRDEIARLAANDPRLVLADSRERIHQFRNVSVKPNEREAAAFPGGPSAFAATLGRHVFQTLGERGIDLHAPDGTRTHVPGYPVTGPTDIVGAGDSTSAGIAAAWACGATPEQAAAFGNLVASITVQQIGVTGTATPAQVLQWWSRQ